MAESDHGWKKSAKLHAALACGVIDLVILGLNYHNENICIAMIDTTKVVISAAVCSRAALSGLDRFQPMIANFRPAKNFKPTDTPQEESN